MLSRHASPSSFALATLAYAFASSSLACKRTPDTIITGALSDNFNQPVRGARAFIRDTAFSVRSDADGRFSLPYTPGLFQLVVEAEGYERYEQALNITIATTHPLGRRMLFRFPSTPPATVAVATTTGYQELRTRLLDRRVVAPNGTAGYQRCAEYHLSTSHAAPTIRGNIISIFFPSGDFALIPVRESLVVSDAFLTSPAPCGGAPTSETRRVNFPGRQVLTAVGLASGRYCYVRVPRLDPRQSAMQEAWCFEVVRTAQPSPVPIMVEEPVLDAPTGQSETDDHTPTGGDPPVECPTRNGAIPCTEDCYRANARWTSPDDTTTFFAGERASGECYGP